MYRWIGECQWISKWVFTSLERNEQKILEWRCWKLPNILAIIRIHDPSNFLIFIILNKTEFENPQKTCNLKTISSDVMGPNSIEIYRNMGTWMVGKISHIRSNKVIFKKNFFLVFGLYFSLYFFYFFGCSIIIFWWYFFEI